VLGGIGWAVVALGTLVALRAALREHLFSAAGALGFGPVTPRTVIVLQLMVAAAVGLAAVALAPSAWRRLKRHP
jgi:hypothetical protein